MAITSKKLDTKLVFKFTDGSSTTYSNLDTAVTDENLFITATGIATFQAKTTDYLNRRDDYLVTE